MPEARARALRHAALLALAGVATILGLACLDRPAGRPDRGAAPGASVVTFRTSDGVTLNGRLWARDPHRVVIYLHEYRGSQRTWWPAAAEAGAEAASALTFDFRGHGASEGDEENVEGIVQDAAAAVAFARERGYQRVVLVGSGMGAAAAIVASAPHQQVAVLGLSAPSEFAGIRADEAIAPVADRIALMAAEGDLSAAQSITDFRQRASIPGSRVVVLRGTEHGEAMLTGDHRSEATAAYRRLLAELWRN